MRWKLLEESCLEISEKGGLSSWMLNSDVCIYSRGTGEHSKVETLGLMI